MTIDFKNLSSLVLDQSFDTSDITRQMEIPIRMPKKDEFFRVHPEHQLGVVGVHRDAEGVYHFVTPEIASLELLNGHVRRVILRLAANTDGRLFVMPLRVADKNGELDEYARTSHLAAEQAEKQWVRIQAAKGQGSYDRYVAARQDRPEPAWPDTTFSEIVEKAFHGNVIDSEDHPLLKQLRGEL
jgi:hypothetical protein